MSHLAEGSEKGGEVEGEEEGGEDNSGHVGGGGGGGGGVPVVPVFVVQSPGGSQYLSASLGPAESSQPVQGRVRTFSQPPLHLSIPGKPQVGAGGPTPDFGSDLAPGSVYDIRG